MINTNENKAINNVLKCDEYLQNSMQIDTIKKVLVEHSDVPEELLDWLIDAVEKNTTLITKAKYNISD